MKMNYVIFLIASMVIIFASNFFGPTEQPPISDIKVKQKAESEFSISKEPYEVEENLLEERQFSTDKYVSFSTPLISGKISQTGGYITELKLRKHYKAPESFEPIEIMDKNEFFSKTIVKAKDINIPKDITFTTSANQISVSNGSQQLRLLAKVGSINIEKILVFNDSTYGIEQKIILTNKSRSNLVFRIFEESVGNIDGPEQWIMGYLLEDDMETVDSIPSETEKIKGDFSWYGFSKKYFLTSNILSDGEKTLKYNKFSKNTLRTLLSYKTISLMPGSQYVSSSTLFVGPKNPEVLKGFGKEFNKAHDLGWFGWLASPLEDLLKICNKFVNNFGVGIILVTILIRLLFLPLTVKSMMSMKKMQAKMALMKPELDAIKEKYKDDKATQNSEIMKVYSKQGMNPLSSLSGCLPMLIQIPVFVALYNVLLYSLDLRHSTFLWINDLSSPEVLFDIPGTGIPFRFLPLIMGISWFLTQKLTQPNPGADEFQTKIFQYMPIMFTVMFWGLPSGLILYWTVSNIISIFQQLYINKKFNKMQGA